MKCPKCNREYDKKTDKCPTCGQDLSTLDLPGPVISNSPLNANPEDQLGPYKFFAAWRNIEKTKLGKTLSVIAIVAAIIIAILMILALKK